MILRFMSLVKLAFDLFLGFSLFWWRSAFIVDSFILFLLNLLLFYCACYELNTYLGFNYLGSGNIIILFSQLDINWLSKPQIFSKRGYCFFSWNSKSPRNTRWLVIRNIEVPIHFFSYFFIMTYILYFLKSQLRN